MKNNPEREKGCLKSSVLFLLSLTFAGCTIDAPLEPGTILTLAFAGDGEGIILVDGNEVKDNGTLICQPGVKVTQGRGGFGFYSLERRAGKRRRKRNPDNHRPGQILKFRIYQRPVKEVFKTGKKYQRKISD